MASETENTTTENAVAEQAAPGNAAAETAAPETGAPMKRAPRRRKPAKPKPSDRARETFRILFEERNLDDTSSFWSDSTTDHFIAAGQTVVGKDALTAWFRELLEAVPDWAMEIENTFDDGKTQAVVQWRGTGTFTGGSFLGIEANGRSVEIRGVDVFRFDDDGLVEENTVYYDGAEFARQIGMLPPRDSAADRLTLAAFNAKTRATKALRRRREGARA
jgi:steroid delta-isomerase-like uncharacterized protein